MYVEMAKILIGPWGLYENWQLAKYILHSNGDKEGEDDFSEPSTTSLSLLMKNINPDRVIVVALDTIYCSSKYTGERGHSAYNEILDSVREHTIKYIKQNIESNVATSVIVSPGVGQFDRGTIIGQMNDFYYVTLYELINEVLKFKDEQEMKFYLDLTHGTNFMPALTYRIIYEVAGILALTKNVKVTVFNSEPYPMHLIRQQENEEVPKLNIHVLEQVDFTKVNAFGRLSQIDQIEPVKDNKFVQPRNYGSNEEKKELGSVFRELSKEYDIFSNELNAFLGGLQKGLSLVVYIFYPDVQKINGFLSENYKKYIEYTEVKGENEKTDITHKVQFKGNFGILSQIYLISSILHLQRKDEINLEDVIKLKETIFKNTLHELFIKREIVELKNAFGRLCCIKSNLVNKWILYDEAFNISSDNKRESDTDIQEQEQDKEAKTVNECIKANEEITTIETRNLLAHAGLSRDFLEVMFQVDFDKDCKTQREDARRILLRYPQTKKIHTNIIKAVTSPG